jgi:hypothetical protein
MLLAATSCAPALPPAAPDIDQDGVADATDRCPGESEDGVDPMPEDGCPQKGES